MFSSAARLGLHLSVLALSLLIAQPASAGGTRKRVIRGYDALDEGEASAAAIDGRGRVSVGYVDASAKIEATASAFRCLHARGRSFVGTADPATIQRVSIDAKTSSPRLRKLAELPGVVVSAMARHPSGDLLAATLPGGEIHRINAKGKVTSFAKIAAGQIWDIHIKGSTIYVATGPRGEVFSLNLAGKAPKVVLDVPEKNILDLEVVGDTVLAATAPKARLYGLGKTKDGVLLKDLPGDELRAIARAGQHLYVATNTFDSRSMTSLQSLTKRLNRSSLTGKGPTTASVEAQVPKADARVYRVDLGRKLDADRISDAPWELALSRSSQYFTSMSANAEGNAVLVASSRGGKIYRVTDHRHVATIADFEERQATDLCRLDDGHFLATAGDRAAVHHLAFASGNRARYTTDIIDFHRPADLGKIALRGKGRLGLRIRSGPNNKVDERWSPWRRVNLKQDAVEYWGSVTGDRRRYVQLEIELAKADSQLRAIELFYNPENLAPIIDHISVRGPSFSRSDDEEPSGRATVKWRARSRDDDTLQFEVKIRPEGSDAEDWIALTDRGPTTKTEFGLDLDSLPDGVYEIGVTASDEPTNGSARARKDELVSDPFRVDRGRPEFVSTKLEKDRIHGSVRDAGSRIYDVAYSIDGQGFRSASPSDGLYDETQESFELRLPALNPGVHRVVLRARDAHGNFTTKAIRVPR